MSSPRIIVDLIGAGGCAYNNSYQTALLWLMTTHGATLVALNEQRIAERKLNIINTAIDEKIRQLKEEVKSLALAEITPCAFGAMVNQVTDCGRLQFDKTKEVMRAKFAAAGITDKDAYARKQLETRFPSNITNEQLFKSQQQYYLDIINALDPGLLNTIFLYANQTLVEQLSHHAEEHHTQLIALDSNRLDVNGIKNNTHESIFKDVFYLTRHLREELKASGVHVSLNPLTMTDIAKNLSRGESFQRMVTKVGSKQEEYTCDVSRLALIYAMAHDTAAKYPRIDITLNFYESDEDTIDNLLRVFRKYPELLPSTVKLVIHPYNGALGEAESVRGTELRVDEDYCQNVRYMIQLAELSRNRESVKYVNCANETDIPTFLANRNFKSDDKTLAAMLDADGCIYNWRYTTLLMKLIKEHGAAIKNAARASMEKSDKKAFCTELLHNITQMDVNGFDAQDYIRLKDYMNLHPDIKVEDTDLLQDNMYNAKEPWAFKIRQYLRYLNEINPKLTDTILYQANEELFRRLVNSATAQGCDHVILLVGSNRQSVREDEHNSKLNGTGSFYSDLHRLTRLLDERYHGIVKFKLDRILMSDIYSGVPAGESYHRALRNSGHEPHTTTVFDETKCSLVIAIMQHIARYYPGVKAVKFFDDRADIFEAIVQAFGKDDTHGLLPQGLPLELITYDGNFSAQECMCVIAGSGAVDSNAHDTVKLMANMCGIDIETVRTSPPAIDFAKVLNFKHLAAERHAAKSPLEVEFESLIESAHDLLNPRRKIGLFEMNRVTLPVPPLQSDMNKTVVFG